MQKNNFDIDTLQKIVKEIACKLNLEADIWCAGHENIECLQCQNNIYIVRVKYFCDTAKRVRKELVDKLNVNKWEIFNEEDLKEKARMVKQYYIANKRKVNNLKKTIEISN